MIYLAHTLDEIQYLKNSIEEKIQYHFLWKNIPKPVIDEDKLLILSILVPNDSTLPRMERDVYITTTMLVQIALDTHELVKENKNDETNKEKLVNQLHVLAGDYYSGLYYYLLASIKDITFIHKLASAIKAINELKMQLHYEEYESLTEYIELKTRMNGVLIETVAEYFDNDSFGEFFKQWAYITTLTTEKEQILKDEILINNMLDSNLMRAYMTNEEKFDAILEKEWISFQSILDELPHSASVFEDYLHQKRISNRHGNTSSVEEG